MKSSEIRMDPEFVLGGRGLGSFFMMKLLLMSLEEMSSWSENFVRNGHRMSLCDQSLDYI